MTGGVQAGGRDARCPPSGNDGEPPLHPNGRAAPLAKSYSLAMTRAILTTLSVLVLAAALSVGLLHAQGSPEGEQPPYRIDLLPGWNLISLPGSPVGRTMESVFGSLKVDTVFAYPAIHGDVWLVALRNAEGEWQGTLDLIVRDWGYWVYTPVGETMEVGLWPDDPTTTYARLPCDSHGLWRLVGVTDAEQRPAGTKIDADDQFSDLIWRVAYGFDTATNQWEGPIRPDSGATVETGAGYWMWAPIFICPLMP